MSAHSESHTSSRLSDASPLRILIVLLVAGMLFVPVASTTFAGPLIPAVDTGGSGSGTTIESELLRGDYSPISTEDTVHIAFATDAVADGSISESEALRGSLSPINGDDSSSIVLADTINETEMIRGDYSPIA